MVKCCKYKIGDFRHKISIEEEQQVADDAGGFVISWQEIASPYAKVETMSANERFINDRIESRATDKFTIRYQDGITETCRIVLRGEYYNIRGIDNVEERNRYLLITAEKKAEQ